jgi:phage FluMu protein Com
MYFKLKCPHCEKSLKVSQELAGSKRACPYCKGTIRIPEQLAPEPAAPSEPAFPGIQITPTIGPKSGRGKGAGAKGSGESGRKTTGSCRASGATDTGDIR